MVDVLNRFDLKDKVAVITGGAGLLGLKHAESLASAGASLVLVDIMEKRTSTAAKGIEETYSVPAMAICRDITKAKSWEEIKTSVMEKFGRVDILINNAANNPKVEESAKTNFTRFENFPIEQWNDDFAVCVTGAFLACQSLGTVMAEKGSGTILNIASDLAVIAPDQRIYKVEGLAENMQNVKPVTYSVVKHGLHGLTKYLSTYWADKGVRVNSISPGGVYLNQPDDFVEKLTSLIPMKRMANPDEYQAAILFLCSDASSYMTGQNLVMDGGRSVW